MKRMSGAVAGSRYVELPRAGHLAHLEAGEAFTTAVGSFLADALAA
jgi:pimeloyl-ACP methyl ester carboxylesterase